MTAKHEGAARILLAAMDQRKKRIIADRTEIAQKQGEINILLDDADRNLSQIVELEAALNALNADEPEDTTGFVSAYTSPSREAIEAFVSGVAA